jgi:hypothetical protein
MLLAPMVIFLPSDFCDESGSADRLLVGYEDTIICEACITLAVARIAEARGR